MLSAKPWRAEFVIQFCTAQFVCLCLGLAAAGLLQEAGMSAFKQPDSVGNILLGTLSFQGAAWLLVLIFLRQHRVRWRDASGFCGPKLQQALLMAVIVAAAILPVAWFLEKASVLVLTRLGWPLESQTAVMLVANTKFLWARVYLGVFAVVLAPVAEEFVFRGILYPFIKQLGYHRLAWLGVSFVFALIHLNGAIFLPLFALALALTWLYEKTDNLLAPITAHALFNAVNFTLLLVQSSTPKT
jgi:membrane protease YdiL (CAAX protease family)